MRKRERHRKVGLLLGLWLLATAFCTAQLPQLLTRGHAHNDYNKAWPALHTALQKGFRSIEVDVYPHCGQLKVAHWPLALNRAADLEQLYFRPLDSLYRAASPWLAVETPLILMIDIKRQGRAAQILLDSICQRYAHLLCFFDADTTRQAPVQLLLSGAYDWEHTQQQQPHYWQIDGRWAQLTAPSQLVPRISQPYRARFTWKGRGAMPETQRLRLEALVAHTQAAGKTLRFWGAPKRLTLWQVFWEAGVDWIQVDDLEAYEQFYQTKQKER
jgi:hypothetical protein